MERSRWQILKCQIFVLLAFKVQGYLLLSLVDFRPWTFFLHPRGKADKWFVGAVITAKGLIAFGFKRRDTLKRPHVCHQGSYRAVLSSKHEITSPICLGTIGSLRLEKTSQITKSNPHPSPPSPPPSRRRRRSWFPQGQHFPDALCCHQTHLFVLGQIPRNETAAPGMRAAPGTGAQSCAATAGKEKGRIRVSETSLSCPCRRLSLKADSEVTKT